MYAYSLKEKKATSASFDSDIYVKSAFYQIDNVWQNKKVCAH